MLFVGRRTLLEATVGSLSDFKIVGWLFVPALLSGLLLLVVVVVARRLFTARVARRWEAIDMDPYYDMDAGGPPYRHHPPPSVPPGNRNAPPWEFLEVTSKLPSFVRNSPDWRDRCEWDPSRWKVTPPADLSFTLLIKQRLRLMGLDWEIPSEWRLDMGSVRFAREYGYTQWLSDNLDLTLLKSCGTFDRRPLGISSFFKRDGAPRNRDHPNVCMSPLDKRWERKRRHLTDCFIAVHQKEHFFFARSVLNELYVRVPDLFAEYEVSYSIIH